MLFELQQPVTQKAHKELAKHGCRRETNKWKN